MSLLFISRHIKNFTEKINQIDFSYHLFNFNETHSNYWRKTQKIFLLRRVSWDRDTTRTSNRSQPRFSSDWMNVTKKLFFQCKKISWEKRGYNNKTRLYNANGMREVGRDGWRLRSIACGKRCLLTGLSVVKNIFVLYASFHDVSCETFNRHSIENVSSGMCDVDSQTSIIQLGYLRIIAFPLISHSLLCFIFCERSIFHQGNEAQFLCCLMLLRVFCAAT